MANYWGKSPLRMKCPHCGRRAEHPVVQTDPANYHWNAERVSFFERIAGQDISYRLRRKECSGCDREFETVEMALMYLRSLMGEVERLEQQVQTLGADLKLAHEERSRLQSAIDSASIVLLRYRSPKRASSRSKGRAGSARRDT